MKSNARVRASLKYNKAHTKQYKLALNLRTDAVLISWLDSLENKQGYLKELILRDLASRS